MRKSSQLQIWLLTGIVALLLIIVPITGFLNNLSGEKKANSGSSTYDVGDAAFVSQFSGLFVWAYVTFIDVSTFSYRLHLVLEPSGAFIDNERLSRTVSLFVNGRPTLLPANQPASTQDFTVTFAEGDMNKYPFDYYADALHVFAQTNVTSGSPETVPLAFSFSGHIQGWNIASSVKETQGDVELLLNLTRSGTTKFFSLFIVILMWALSLTILALAVTLWIRKRKVEPPTIAVGAALLFALPAIRNTQPGVPTIGCTVDAVGFFWNMALIAISVLLLMWNYVVMYTKPPSTHNPAGDGDLKKKKDDLESPRPQTDTSMATLL